VPDHHLPGDSWVPAALSALDTALAPGSTPIEFHPAASHQNPDWSLRAEVPSDRAAVIVRTSGSTGTPKQTMLPREAIRSSVAATAEALGGHGQWLLTLQPSYVAGLAVLARSLAAGTTPVPLLQHSTDASIFTRAAQQLTSRRRYVSLVPTQLQRLLDQVPADPALAHILARFDAILLGGGPSSAELLAQAETHGLRVLRTYGMSETCGGCVYDGYPLDGVQLSRDDSGRVRITGPMVAAGYLNDPALTDAHFSIDPESKQRSFLTDDLGQIHTVAGHQELSISGRADDVINTGGVKVSAESVRTTLLTHPQVREAFVGALADPEWGQRLSAVLVLSAESDPAELTLKLEQLVRDALGRAAVPKQWLRLPELPLLANGKPDRQELLRLLSAASR